MRFTHRLGLREYPQRLIHDSNGAKAFIEQCITRLRQALPGILIEIRMDSAFFSEEIVALLDREQIEYTISVPFERLPTLKEQVEQQDQWHCMDAQCDYTDRRSSQVFMTGD